MSGWLLFFLFLAIIGRPEGKAEGRGAVVALVASVALWAVVCLGLLAGALRTGGYL